MDKRKILQLRKSLLANYGSPQAMHAAFVKSRKLAEARTSLLAFTTYTMPRYEVNWHHKLLCDYLDAFVRGDIKNLMVFMPPRHGKSELTTRRIAAQILGVNPHANIACIAYSSSLANGFCKDVQRIIDSDTYREIFPNTTLQGYKKDGKAVSDGNEWKRTESMFEVVGHRGKFFATGRSGGITGKDVDFLFIDDPIKNDKEAYSKRERDALWNGYIGDTRTRLTNTTQQLITLTRWHEDDLAGRIINKLSKDKGGKEDWVVFTLPAIKTDDSNPLDPRKIGEALWPARKSLENLLIEKDADLVKFTAMYQQRPAPQEGDVIKRHWFKRFRLTDLPKDVVWHVMGDTAYTANKNNDPTGLMAYTYYEGNFYIRSYSNLYLEFPDLCDEIPHFAMQNGVNQYSNITFEPKASGLSVIQQLKKEIPSLNIYAIKPPRTDKEVRVRLVTPSIRAGRWYLLENAGWIDNFMMECISFPHGEHDEAPDLLAMIHDFVSEPEQKQRELTFLQANDHSIIEDVMEEPDITTESTTEQFMERLKGKYF